MPQERKGNNGGRGQSQGPATANGGQGYAAQGGGATAQAGGADLRARAGEVSQAAREQYDQARELVAHRYRRTEGMIARNPGTSVLVGFGLGLGAGLLLTALFGREEETWYDRYVPARFRDLPERLHDVPDRLGRLRVKEHVHDLSSRLRDLPEQVLERIRS